jgi:hypothetical protein
VLGSRRFDVLLHKEVAKENEIANNHALTKPPFVPNWRHVIARRRVHHSVGMNADYCYKLQKLSASNERSCPSYWKRIMQIHDKVNQSVDETKTSYRKIVNHCGHSKSSHMMKEMKKYNRFSIQDK